MVPDSGAAARANQLRSLNVPRPIRVLLNQDGHPAVLLDGPRRARVEAIQDLWRIDDEWWRVPISRLYYRLVLDGGRLRTVYHDLLTDAWYAQAY